MKDLPTCGRGLAENSVVPARIAELILALAENLEAHLPTLDLTDPKAQVEQEAYQSLAAAYRQIALQLRATAEQMAGSRTLPMAQHDPKALLDPRILVAFERFVALEKEIRDLLQTTTERDDQMLAHMRGTQAAARAR